MALRSGTPLGLSSAALVLLLGCGDHDAPRTGVSGAGSGGVTSRAEGGAAGIATTGGELLSGATNGGAPQAGEQTGGAPTGPASSRQTARPSGSEPGTKAGYWEYLPPHYGNGALYPLLVFRHGAGQNGNGASDLPKVLKHGPPHLIQADEWPEDRPFVVLSVQHGPGCPTAQEVADFFTFALSRYDIDPSRVYFTGLSCGANGGWNYLGEHLNEVVAASVLIAGDARGAFARQGCGLGTVPIWAFHGDMDQTVLPAYDGEPIASLQQCDPAPVDLRYTLYPGVPHNSWTMTYDLSNPENDIYAWMLSHAK